MGETILGNRYEIGIKEICQDLINEANNNSGKDNISVILSKID